MQFNKTCHYINPRYNILCFAPCTIQHRSYHNKTKLQKVFKVFHIHWHTHVTVKHHKAFVESKTSPFPRTVRCTNMIHTLLCCQFLCLLQTTCELHITNYLQFMTNLAEWFLIQKGLNKATSIQLWMCR